MNKITNTDGTMIGVVPDRLHNTSLMLMVTAWMMMQMTAVATSRYNSDDAAMAGGDNDSDADDEMGNAELPKWSGRRSHATTWYMRPLADSIWHISRLPPGGTKKHAVHTCDTGRAKYDGHTALRLPPRLHAELRKDRTQPEGYFSTVPKTLPIHIQE